MQLVIRPAIDWASVTTESTNIVIDLAWPGERRMVVIPFDALPADRRDQIIADPGTHVPLIERALSRAWNPERLKDITQLTGEGAGQRVLQCWLTADHFS